MQPSSLARHQILPGLLGAKLAAETLATGSTPPSARSPPTCVTTVTSPPGAQPARGGDSSAWHGTPARCVSAPPTRWPVALAESRHQSLSRACSQPRKLSIPPRFSISRFQRDRSPAIRPALRLQVTCALPARNHSAVLGCQASAPRRRLVSMSSCFRHHHGTLTSPATRRSAPGAGHAFLHPIHKF
ncbi:hypothetical protein K491DRAFT_274183 [Lophiostoma macrostomum CBS 122681]|uniref:Uncharacterized protein n=1 Tax=Lophiostoma macrostomum CBS 122681 TaxID=1314788 RepID=A0A6A6TG16_9PLEO|nr:hypothetical protein K491DRAFT_274183 [Lophiostoma macrostomum CBS 122681]